MTPSSTQPALQHLAPTGEVGGWQPLENPAAGEAAPLAAVASEVDAILAVWRERVLRVLLAVYSTVALVPLSALLVGRGLVLPWPLRAACVLLYLIMLLATLRARFDFRTRVGILLAKWKRPTGNGSKRNSAAAATTSGGASARNCTTACAST